MNARAAKHGMEQLKSQFHAKDLRLYEAVFLVLESMHRDFHDTRGLPSMSLKEHCDYYQFDEALASFVRENLANTHLTVKDLKDAGVPPEFSIYVNLPDDFTCGDAMAIQWEGHALVCFYHSLRYLDLANPNVLYSGWI